MVAIACVSCGAVNKPLSPATESDCSAAGGTWTPIESLRENRYCDLKTSDAGRWCVDGMQCQGECVASDKAKAGSLVVGHCSEHSQDYGTTKLVKWGRVKDPVSVQ